MLQIIDCNAVYSRTGQHMCTSLSVFEHVNAVLMFPETWTDIQAIT